MTSIGLLTGNFCEECSFGVGYRIKMPPVLVVGASIASRLSETWRMSKSLAGLCVMSEDGIVHKLADILTLDPEFLGWSMDIRHPFSVAWSIAS